MNPPLTEIACGKVSWLVLEIYTEQHLLVGALVANVIQYVLSRDYSKAMTIFTEGFSKKKTGASHLRFGSIPIANEDNALPNLFGYQHWSLRSRKAANDPTYCADQAVDNQ